MELLSNPNISCNKAPTKSKAEKLGKEHFDLIIKRLSKELENAYYDKNGIDAENDIQWSDKVQDVINQFRVKLGDAYPKNDCKIKKIQRK